MLGARFHPGALIDLPWAERTEVKRGWLNDLLSLSGGNLATLRCEQMVEVAILLLTSANAQISYRIIADFVKELCPNQGWADVTIMNAAHDAVRRLRAL